MISRPDVQLLVDNWSDIELKHKQLRDELANVERELRDKEDDLKQRFKESQNAFHQTFTTQVEYPGTVGSKVLKPGSKILGSSFSWGAKAKASVYTQDLIWPERTLEKALGLDIPHKPLPSTIYGALSRYVDDVGPGTNIYTNPYGRKGASAKPKFYGRL